MIKVEPPEGDTLRAWKTEGVSTHWKIYARNKKSLCLDLREPARVGAHQGTRSLRPAFRRELSAGRAREDGPRPGTLLELNPGLVIVRISGWGQDGPYRQRPGFGTVIEGISGFAAINGFADREPVLPPMYLADGMAGLYGASAAMIALREVEVRDGQGQVIDLPLLDPLFAILTRRPPTIVSPARSSRAPAAARRTRRLAMPTAARTEVRKPVRFDSEDGRAPVPFHRPPDLIDDPRFRTNADRVRNAEELDAIIGAFIAERTQAENVAFFEAAEVTIGPIYDTAQILGDPHLIEREIIADYPDPEMGPLPMHHVVPRLSGTPGSIRTPAPALGSTTGPCLPRSESTTPPSRADRIRSRSRRTRRVTKGEDGS